MSLIQSWPDSTICSRVFRTTWELCLVNLTTSLQMTACMRSVRGGSNSNKTLDSSPLFLTPSALTTITCIFHQAINEASPLWQLMPKGERSEEREEKLSYSGGVGYVDIKTVHMHVYHFYVACIILCLMHLVLATIWTLNSMSYACGQLFVIFCGLNYV
jgi:hypothetical protein